MKKNKTKTADHHCNVREQRRLVSEMTRCDNSSNLLESRYECYVRVSRASREKKACLFA